MNFTRIFFLLTISVSLLTFKGYCQVELDSIFSDPENWEDILQKLTSAKVKKASCTGTRFRDGVGTVVMKSTITEDIQNKSYRIVKCNDNTCQVIHSLFYQYDDHGNLAKHSYKVVTDEKEKKISVTTYQYNDSDKLVYKTTLDGETLAKTEEKMIKYRTSTLHSLEFIEEWDISRNSDNLYDTTLYRLKTYKLKGEMLKARRTRWSRREEPEWNNLAYNTNGQVISNCYGRKDSIEYCFKCYYTGNRLDSVRYVTDQGSKTHRKLVYSNEGLLVELYDNPYHTFFINYDQDGTATGYVHIYNGVHETESRFTYYSNGLIKSTSSYSGGKLFFRQDWRYTY